jgi:hypothetical protein
VRTVEPRIGQAFAEWMVAQDHHKDHAADTPFRFSGVMDCSRKLGYKAAKLPETDAMDGASLAIAKMGSLLHDDVQAAIQWRWPTATIEAKGQVGDLISGHYDGLVIDDAEDQEIIEIKTVGAYKFDLSNGYFRSPGKGQPARVRPEGGQGPSASHICQGGMNAVAHGRSKVRIVYLSREAVSVNKAQEMGLGPIDRFWSEWVFTKAQWLPLVEAEVERLSKIRAIVEAGEVPGRSMYDDKTAKYSEPDPETHPLCGYCNQAHRCKMDGPGRIRIELSKP